MGKGDTEQLAGGTLGYRYRRWCVPGRLTVRFFLVLLVCIGQFPTWELLMQQGCSAPERHHDSSSSNSAALQATCPIAG